MLVIRLARIGTKNKPNYRIIITEKGRDNYGNVLENLGTYNTSTKALKLEEAKVKAWISKGAQLSATLNNLFIDKGIIKGEKMKSRRMNTEKLVKARADKDVAAKKKIEDDKAAAEAAKAAEIAAKEAEAAAKAEAAAAPVVENPVAEVK
ncbi:MAG: 30S ribosomal protein S16 [Patescibacteria group bacterium]|nr:30S ribosomal protein S16 [Patescibacteria group bacterium]